MPLTLSMSSERPAIGVIAVGVLACTCRRLRVQLPMNVLRLFARLFQ